MKKAALHSLGCKVNSYESERIKRMLIDAGYRMVDFHDVADVYVVNTCTVTNTADHKSRQMLHGAKRRNPSAVVAAVGCYVNVAGEKLKKDPLIDVCVGHAHMDKLPRLISECNEGMRQDERAQDADETVRTRAFLKVQDGCNQFCSYCIIPYARGRARSRSIEDVVSETRELSALGYREIVLTGIHIASYGYDLGYGLTDLLRKIHGVDGIERIRLSSIEPGLITDDFAKELKSLPKVCPHFHLSLQSGSASVLKRMNRRYTPEEYLEKCATLRKYYENPAITTDMIVGFPGESEDEFAESLGLIRKAKLSDVHVFAYSARDKTKAALMPGQIDSRVKADRSKEMISLAAELSREYRALFYGKKVSVLFEKEMDREGVSYFSGFTSEYIRVCVQSEENLRNRIVELEFCPELYYSKRGK